MASSYSSCRIAETRPALQYQRAFTVLPTGATKNNTRIYRARQSDCATCALKASAVPAGPNPQYRGKRALKGCTAHRLSAVPDAASMRRAERGAGEEARKTALAGH